MSWVMGVSEVVPPGALSFEPLASLAHLRQAVAEELAATAGKYAERGEYKEL